MCIQYIHHAIHVYDTCTDLRFERAIVCACIHARICPYIQAHMHPSMQPSMHLCMRPHIQQCFHAMHHSCAHASIDASIHASVHTSTYPSHPCFHAMGNACWQSCMQVLTSTKASARNRHGAWRSSTPRIGGYRVPLNFVAHAICPADHVPVHRWSLCLCPCTSRLCICAFTQLIDNRMRIALRRQYCCKYVPVRCGVCMSTGLLVLHTL